MVANNFLAYTKKFFCSRNMSCILQFCPSQSEEMTSSTTLACFLASFSVAAYKTSVKLVYTVLVYKILHEIISKLNFTTLVCL